MARFQRNYSRPEQVERWRQQIDQCLCRGVSDSGRPRHGIIHKVYAARNYDGVRCLVAWDSLTDGNPVFLHHDVLDVDAY